VNRNYFFCNISICRWSRYTATYRVEQRMGLCRGWTVLYRFSIQHHCVFPTQCTCVFCM